MHNTSLKKNKFFIAFFGCLILTVTLVCAQFQDIENIKFDRISSENVKIEKGLSQNSVQCILQDQIGYIWFGTWDGLNKYDGYRFTIFDKENKITGQTVNCLCEDSEGYVWIGTDEGLNRYDRTVDEFVQFKNNPGEDHSLVNDFITTIIEDSAGFIWIGTQGGISKFDKKTSLFDSYLNTPLDNTSLKSNYINSLCFDHHGFLWIATRIGLIRFEPHSLKVTRLYSKPNDQYSLPDNFVKSVFCDYAGILWIGTNGGLSRLDSNTDNFENYFLIPYFNKSLNSNPINVIYEDARHFLWIGTEDDGLKIVEPETGKIVNYRHLGSDFTSLSNNRVLSIYEDRSGTVWVGTFIGINKFDRHSSKFTVFRNIPNDINSLNSNYVMSIYEDKKQKAWIATNQGINILDRNTGKFTFIMHVPGNPRSLINNNLRVIIEDSRNRIWIGTQNDGLECYTPERDEFTLYQNNPKDNSSLGSNDILSILEDSYGLLWVGTGHGGLNIFMPDRKEFIVYKNNPLDSSSISSNQIWTIYEDPERNLWLGTADGLNRFDRSKKEFTRYRCTPGKPYSLNAKEVFCIYEDTQGILWVGTKGGGLNRFNKEKSKFTAYTETQGIPNNVVYGILEDESGYLWLSTNWGLSKFDPRNENFINYDVQDGLQSNEFNLGAYYKNDKGEMYFGGMNGFNLFQPSEIKINPLKPRTVITSVKIFNQEIPREWIDGDTINLSANDNFFTIEFSALDYTNPAKNKYTYILENYDKVWSSVNSDKRYADYTNVKPGIYHFRVMGSNNDGVWDNKGSILTIIIKPHWYNTWLFRIPVIILITWIIWFLIYRRIRIIRNRHEVEKKVLDIEKQLYDTELQALRLQMNPHFIFNTLNSIQSFILTKDTDKAVNYLGKFSQLMRLILTHSTETYISISEELKALRYYMDIEMLRFENKFTYTITVDPGIDEEFTEVPPMIIQPYVENAIIHGLMHKKSNGRIDIHLKPDNNSILWIIEDNGIGREKSMQIQKKSGLQRKSRGMLITMERLEVLNKKNNENYSIEIIDLKDGNSQPNGTRVELRMPYNDG